MGFDPRLKTSLHRDAESIDPNVEWRLEQIEQRRRRAQPGGTMAGLAVLVAVGVVAVIVLAVFAGPAGLRTGASPSPSPSTVPTASAPIYTAIAGTYVATLTAAQPNVASNSLIGDWTITLGADGVLGLAPPPGFTAEGPAPSGNAFSIAGSSFRTNLFSNDFCNSVGTYRWTRSGAQLTFTVVADQCTVRITLLATSAWHLAGPSPSP